MPVTLPLKTKQYIDPGKNDPKVGPVYEIFKLIAYASSEGFGEPALSHRLAGLHNSHAQRHDVDEGSGQNLNMWPNLIAA